LHLPRREDAIPAFDEEEPQHKRGFVCKERLLHVEEEEIKKNH